jgi:hypothetical protein
MAYELDYDDIKYKELEKHLTDYCSIEDFPHCLCSDRWVECISEDFEHWKRNYFVCDIEYMCMNCEQSWIKRIHLNAFDYEFKLTQMPTLSIEGGEEE